MKEKDKMVKIMSIIAAVLLVVLIALIITRPAVGEWQYTLMGTQVNYIVGQRVTSGGRVYECTKWDEGSPLVIVPPEANPDWWAEVQ